jgi:hypothetical protein
MGKLNISKMLVYLDKINAQVGYYLIRKAAGINRRLIFFSLYHCQFYFKRIIFLTALKSFLPSAVTALIE